MVTGVEVDGQGDGNQSEMGTRNNETLKYSFPHIPLDPATRLWLEAAYARVKKGGRVDTTELMVELWGKIPNDFDYKGIDQRLFQSGDLTLLGILHIDPTSVFPDETDQVIRFVKESIRKNPGILTVTASEVSDGTGITAGEVSIIFKLMRHLGDFWYSATGDERGAYVEVRIEHEDVKREYLRYEGLGKLIDQINNKNAPKQPSKQIRRDGSMPRKELTIFQSAFGRYRVLGKIGEGGSGIVYKVEDDEGQPFALKCLDLAKIHQQKIKRFQNELFFCLNNTHPNIVRVLDWGAEEISGVRCPFYVMPFFPSTLRTLTMKGIPADRVLLYFSQMLDGVECAHLLGVVHRDLKPENFLFDPEADSIVLCDFGIAHFSEEVLHTAVETGAAERLANFQYAAPEQRDRTKAVDHRADIFALGLILNEMFTRTVPQGTEFTKVSRVAPNHAYLDDLVERMMRQSPDARPQSIDQIKRHLIGKRNDFIVQQKISELKRQVVPTSDVQDELVITLPRIIDVDYRDGDLIFKLSPKPNPDWLTTFQFIDFQRAVQGYEPSNFRFHESDASIFCPEDFVETVDADFRRFLEKANNQYKFNKTNEQKKRDEEQRAQLRKTIEEEERRQRVRKKIKL